MTSVASENLQLVSDLGGQDLKGEG